MHSINTDDISKKTIKQYYTMQYAVSVWYLLWSKDTCYSYIVDTKYRMWIQRFYFL